MFGWDLCRTAEAMFSRWAVKRLLRFLLKKKLGDYILGDIDLVQLDVQLRRGIVQLTDLALNVDFLNAMLGSVPVIVKEGSIASLSVKVPFNMKDWQIEVEELELVIAPNGFSRGSAAIGNAHVEVDHDATVGSPKKHEENGEEGSSHSAFTNIHEGVKTVAKIVKLFLTSFHVRLKNLILAFDPGSAAAERNPELCRMLVLRVTEIEFGTCISEDITPFGGPSILGISKLTNFIKFHGAVVDFLEINHTDKKKQSSCLLGRSFNEFYSENSSSLGFTTKILGGPSGGFSGVLDLSIPWKNGCLDIHKLSAEVSIDPVHAFLLPSTIMWLVSLRRHLGEVMNDCRSPGHLPTDSGYFKPSLHGNSDGPDSSLLPQEIITARAGSYTLSSHSPPSQERVSDALHPSPHVIHNWIPLPADFDANFEAESNYEASIDQFFECFDEMRSSQASLGNSGIWNLACSVFSAITAASNIASGSEHIISEQQNGEATLKATVAAISVALLFNDERKHSSQLNENHEQIYDMGETQYKSFTSVGLVDSSIKSEGFESCMGNLPFTDSEQSTKENLERHDMHLLNISCLNLTLTFQIFPQCTKFGLAMQHIKVNDHYHEWQSLGNNCLHCINEFPKQTHVQHLQAGVQNALPPFSSVSKDGETDDAPCMPEFHPMMQPAEENMHADIFSGPPLNESLKITLFESFGDWSGEYFASSTSLSMKTMASTSFSLKLPPFIFWVDICLVNSLMNFFKQIESSIHTSNSTKAPECDVRVEETNLSTDRDAKGAKPIELASSNNLQGNIVLPTARIILCLDLSIRHHNQVYQWDTFISVDISGATSKKCNNATRIPTRKSHRSHSNSDYMTISLDSGNVDVYLVTVASENDLGTGFQSTGTQLYSSSRILSATRQLSNHHSTFSLILQKGHVTDSQVTSRVWNLAASKDPRSRNKISGSGDDFAVVTTAPEVSDSQVRQELIRSSAFLIHIQFSLFSASIRRHEYIRLHHIVNKILDSLHCDVNSDDVVDEGVHNKSTTTAGNTAQASILAEFDFVDLCITSDVVQETSKLLQRELPGSWTSLRLKVEKFELLSVSNVGGLRDASFFGISHGEGDLWGSVSSMNESPSAGSHEFLLITCKNSILRRGDGVGGNATSSGTAGTSILHFKNPQACCASTTVVLQCGTIIAPGCRLDWFNTIVTFFRPPCFQEEAGDLCESNTSNADMQYKSFLCLDLVDVALSYEPHIVGVGVSGFSHNSSDMKSLSNQSHVSCILAASSFNLCQTVEDASNDNYSIRLQDLGLLICQWPGFNKDKRYDVDHLHKIGYVKIASDATVAAVVRTNCDNDLPWEIEFTSLHVKMNTCGDTTTGLVCLLCQLQELFAPDLDDALVHLQSRWSSIHPTQESDKLSTNDISELVSGIEPQSGLMDEVVDDIFYYQEENIVQSNSCNLQNELLRKDFVGEPRDLNVSWCSNSVSPYSVSSVGSEQDLLQPPCADRVCLPDVMEGYYVTELLPKAKHSPSHRLLDEVPGSQANTSHRNVNEKSGWYKNDSLVIVENHVSITSDHHLDKQFINNDNINIHPFPAGTCKPRGRIILKQIEVRWRMFGGTDWSSSLGRDQSACLELQLLGINLQHDMYPDGELIVSNLSLTIREFFLYDNSLDAPWKMVLGYYHSKKHPRESCAKALKLNLESVRPNPAIPLEEYRFQLAILPLRLHLDQSQLDFLVSFFSGVSVSESADGKSNLNQQLHPEDESCSNVSLPKEALLPFFQKCDIWPIIIRVDYIPRHINVAALRGGKYIELINLVSWKGIDLHLKHVHAVGLYGWGGIGEAVAGEWLEDISKNQVHKLLKGLKPISSLFSVSSGAAKLVSLPVKDYKNNRRLVKGIQRGAISFIRSISVEAVGLGVHLAGGVHDILLKTECALAGSPHLVAASTEERTSSTRSNQPKDVHQGMQQAYDSLSDGIGRTASALVGRPLKTYQRGAGAGLALVSAIRAAPAAAVAPASSAAQAVHYALLGVRNSLDPEHKKDSMEKYHGSSRYQDYDNR